MTSQFEQLFSSYISIVSSEETNSELYKWQAVEYFQKNWNINAPDFHEMFKRAFSKRSNLLFQNSYGFLNTLSREMPEEARLLFRELFDETVPIMNRITNHRDKSDQLLILLKKKLEKENFSHQQDERTVSFILTLYSPGKYYLYKENIYKAFCNLLNVSQMQKAGEKYLHFVELAEPFLVEIEKNQEILTLSPQNFDFDGKKLLLQDILYRTLIVNSHDNKMKELLARISEDVKSKLEDLNHPLASHKWYDNNAKDYRQVSVFPNEEISYLHYEIMMRTNEIAWEFHPEGNAEAKDFMIPFIEKYNFNRYKKTPWKHNLPTGRYEKGKYFKIVPTQKIKLFRSENYYPRMIQLLTEQFIELYEDTNHRLRHYLLLEGQPKQDLLKEPQMKTILNQILYGPPGTGKTYTTIDKVVEICEPTEYVKNDHDANKEVYDRLIRDGRVEFTTFHQSMAYEDFIEGIKPVKPEDNDPFLKYDIEPGVFRRIAKSAEKLVHVNNHTVEWDKVRYFKMSIGGKNRPEIHDYCISKNMVGLGWGGDEDLSEVSDFKDWKTYRDTYIKLFPDTANENRYHIQASYIFNRVNIGDIVVVTKGNHIIDAIGKVIGNYEYNDQNPTGFYHFRKVEWITTNMDASPGKFFEKQISQQSIYEFYDEDVKKETFKELTSIEEKEAKPYVLVIDEINRGNVSAIFGELITLIEEDKRQGATNELFVTLPYSKKRFTVPSNLHIIGTMNTADRSVEALDTALRRRFSFVEMLPDPKLLSTKGTNGDGMIEDVNLQELLTTINSRIEVLIDRDHTIGHAFFINDKSIDDLKHTFKNKIIPLLQEYFYGNYEKMALVIGNSFFHIQDQKSVVFAETTNDYDLSNKIYTILDCTAEGFDFITAIQKLMNKTISQQTQVRTDSSYGDN